MYVCCRQRTSPPRPPTEGRRVTLAELIDACRRYSGDTASPGWWSDDQWTVALNEAETEACIRSKLIEDDSITSDAAALDPYVKIPARAFSVRSVLVAGVPIELLSRGDFEDRRFGDWTSATGSPTECYRIGDKLRLYPTPIANADVTMVAFCAPKAEMLLDEADTAEPEIPGRLHVKLVDWALARFFEEPDADHFNAGLSLVHDGRFTDVFGPRPVETETQRAALKVRRSSRGCFV